MIALLLYLASLALSPVYVKCKAHHGEFGSVDCPEIHKSGMIALVSGANVGRKFGNSEQRDRYERRKLRLPRAS